MDGPPVIGAVVQARLGSRRLPGKVLRRVAGRPLLAYLLERLDRCRTLDRVIVATSTDPGDDALARWCADHGVECQRGPLEDVAARMAAVARDSRLDAFARLCADSPLLDPALVDEAVTLYRQLDVDLVTNVAPRTFPRGQSVEVVRTATFLRIEPALRDPAQREHVTSSLYERLHERRVHRIVREPGAGDVRLVVDTPEDLEHLAALVAAMSRPQWQYSLNDILELRRAMAARASCGPRSSDSASASSTSPATGPIPAAR